MRKLSVIALALFATATPAMADDRSIGFYSARNCQELDNVFEKIGLDGIDVPKPGFVVKSGDSVLANCTAKGSCQNDKYQSVWIGPTVPAGTRIKVWDDSRGSPRDDWATILVKEVPSKGVCVKTFEITIDTAAYRLDYHRVDNLNGHISLIQVVPAPRTPARPTVVPEKRGTLSNKQVRILKK